METQENSRILRLEEDNYQDLMQNWIHEILLVSSFYDAFIFQEEGILSEQFFGEYDQLNLRNIPRITSVQTGEEALEILKHRRFDLVITMMRIGDITPYILSEEIKKNVPDLPVILLINIESDIVLINRNIDKMQFIDDVFYWHGDNKLFLAIIKYIEDFRNVEQDTANGLVRVILLVEDSVLYYSRFLPLLYSEIMQQTQRLISAELNITNKRNRMKLRPKVLMVHTFEEAQHILEKYRDYIICLISDIKYPVNGEPDEDAGFKLIRQMKTEQRDMSMLLQSSDVDNAMKANDLDVDFLYKNSDTLLEDLRKYILQNLGFGDLIFRNKFGDEVARVTTLLEFEKTINDIPDESLIFHALRNHFSAWLIAHGEINLAKRMRPLRLSNFSSPNRLRRYLRMSLRDLRNKKNCGKVLHFDKNSIDLDFQVSKLKEGSLGGKGRGIAFLNKLLLSLDLRKEFPEVSIKVPRSFIVGSNEFDEFLACNYIKEQILKLPVDKKSLLKFWNDNSDAANLLNRITASDEEIKNIFVKGKLSKSLQKNLYQLLEVIKTPLAIRSSGLLEDSQSQPFAGIYQTFMIPNNESDIELRLKKLMDAIKLVFSSVYLKSARQYIRSINFKVEDEKMAVIIQEVIGTKFDNLYYPNISGVAQSFNYYPTAHLKNRDGIATIATGLGKSVVDGETNYVFCPNYPKLSIISEEKIINSSQKDLYALDLDILEEEEMIKHDGVIKKKIRRLKQNGSLDHVVSVWDYENNRLRDGIEGKGPLIVTFADVLKYSYFPLAEIIQYILKICERAMGVPVEIEFAVNLGKGAKKRFDQSFYLLQIRPLNVSVEDTTIEEDELDKDQLVMFTDRGMGNGIFNDIRDFIVFNPETFNNTKTREMVLEIEAFNERLKKDDKQYILIGPGRWGSRDEFLGIPVKWGQISNAKAIIEVGIQDFNIDASQGTHFFHNLVAMNAGYFNIPYNSQSSHLNLDWIFTNKVIQKNTYFSHIELEKEIVLKIDGQKGIAYIAKK